MPIDSLRFEAVHRAESLVEQSIARRNLARATARARVSIGLCAWFCALATGWTMWMILPAVLYAGLAAFEIEQERRWREELRTIPQARWLV